MARILMVAPEATPFAKTGGLADVIGALPAALHASGQHVAVVIPWYRGVRLAGSPKEAFRDLRVFIGPREYRVNIFETVERGVTFYLVSCPPLFDRAGLYGEHSVDYPDNHIRFGVFCRAALDVARHLFLPDILHCHDWQSALAPIYLRYAFAADPTFLGMRVLFTIHNLGYQGLFPPEALHDLGLGDDIFQPNVLEFFGRVNLLMGGLHFSDAINTVSRGYAREIQTPEFGFGLDAFLRARAGRLSGILNGVDYQAWSPQTDVNIARNYSAANLPGKSVCKRALLEQLGLPTGDLTRPVIGMVSRMVNQKGFDLLAEAADDLLAEDILLAVLGSGEPAYEKLFRDLAAAHPEKVGVHIGYDNALAHRIEAGADMFLMPSYYEPCGLNQIYSLRYGTVPIVRAVGGLEDTIDETTGFKFHDYTGEALLTAVRRALDVYADRPRWQEMMRRGMKQDFSWEFAASHYAALYRSLLS
ncbi:MAG: glycogen synthase GlgA [Bryobacteraceae bacterium]|jgi:starch synthase